MSANKSISKDQNYLKSVSCSQSRHQLSYDCISTLPAFEFCEDEREQHQSDNIGMCAAKKTNNLIFFLVFLVQVFLEQQQVVTCALVFCYGNGARKLENNQYENHGPVFSLTLKQAKPLTCLLSTQQTAGVQLRLITPACNPKIWMKTQVQFVLCAFAATWNILRGC